MGYYTSQNFFSASAKGQDWRAVVKNLMDLYKAAQKEHGVDETKYNLGFVYVSDAISKDIESVLDLMKSVTGIEKWSGCSGVALYATDAEYLNEPAVSVLFMRVPDKFFRMIPATESPAAAGTDQDAARAHLSTAVQWQKALSGWLNHMQPMLTMVHGVPDGETDYGDLLPEMDQFIGGFTTGGLTSGRQAPCHIQQDGAHQKGFSGVVFSQHVGVATAVSQGCLPIGPFRTVTKAERHVIQEIDGRNAYDVLKEDVMHMAAEKTGVQADALKVKETRLQKLKSFLRGPEKHQEKHQAKNQEKHSEQDRADHKKTAGDMALTNNPDDFPPRNGDQDGGQNSEGGHESRHEGGQGDGSHVKTTPLSRSAVKMPDGPVKRQGASGRDAAADQKTGAQTEQQAGQPQGRKKQAVSGGHKSQAPEDGGTAGRVRHLSTGDFPGLNVKMDLGDGKTFQGDIHVAFAVKGSDKEDDYLVRHALAVDQSNGYIAVAEKPVVGERVMFVKRDTESVKADLSRMLLSLRERIGTDGMQDKINVRAAIYISCAGRKVSAYEQEQITEIQLIREILGDIPLAGFAASGEISNARIYGYAGLLILFL
ncbi:MAG: FIST N-terminal domain-containing protein [Alphaproteobacteria bacterium]|jgi:small ligand-binding sensory domain FIST|nr:FIST N-terminal domain-containing protein [Alphaproteobacteria bacterium]MDP7221654.1 FIST N-terminal domain-containing protein [Alphaproteobacteria bacterium]